MYNSFMPQGDYEPTAAPERPEGEGRKGILGSLGSLFGGEHKGILGGLLGGGGDGSSKLDGLLKTLHLDRFDKGDILLLLVLGYLFLESDDEDWLIVLALVILMGL